MKNYFIIGVGLFFLGMFILFIDCLVSIPNGFFWTIMPEGEIVSALLLVLSGLFIGKEKKQGIWLDFFNIKEQDRFYVLKTIRPEGSWSDSPKRKQFLVQLNDKFIYLFNTELFLEEGKSYTKIDGNISVIVKIS